MMSVTDWYLDFQQKRENRIIKQYQQAHPEELWRQHTDVIRSYGQQTKSWSDPFTAGNIKRGLDQFTLDNYQDRELLHKAQDTKYFDSKNMGSGVRVYNQGDVTGHLKSALTEAAKDDGTGKLSAFGIETGTSHTLAQAKAAANKAYNDTKESWKDVDELAENNKYAKYMANKAGNIEATVMSRLPAAKDMVGHFVGASAKESFMNSLGLMTADQKRLYSRPGVSNFLARNSIRSAGLFNIYTALTSDDPIVDTTAQVMSGFGMQAGWRGGKAAANVLFGKSVGHASRVLLGGAGAVAGLAIPLIGGEIMKDITKSDSGIKKVMKGSYKQESLVEDRSSRMALTMRQAGLQKLASSHLNDRGMLLGNEAAILKGVSY